MTDLNPDVRARAAEFLALAEKSGQLGAGSGIFIDRLAYWRAVVDTAVAVVAPQIARPLQARIEELEAEMSELIYDGSIELVWLPAEARARLSQAINEARELLAKGEKP